MSTGYLAVLLAPGALRAFLPALVGRLSFAMVTLVVLFAVQQATGSFAIAGAATGAFGAANVVASPYRARLVDRVGQRIALNALAVGFAAGLGAIALLTAQPNPSPVAIVGLAAVAGLFPPPLGASMRVLWGSLTPPGPLRTRAYSIDAVCEEILFTVGPLIAAVAVGTGSPTVALSVTAAVALVGTAGMTSSPLSGRRTAVAATAKTKQSRPLRQPGFVAVLVALLGVGVVLGTVEIVAPAIAADQSSVQLAGILLAAFAGGSAVGGMLYGHRTWRSSLRIRLFVAGVVMTVLCALLSAAGSVVVVGVGLAMIGFFLAPSLVTGYLLADDLTSVDARTEASSWINTAVNAGAAAAAAAIGLAVELVEPRLGFLIGAVTALVLLLIAAAPRLRTSHLARRVGRSRVAVSRGDATVS